MWFRAFGRLVVGLIAVLFIVTVSSAATVFTPRVPVVLHLGDGGLIKVTFGQSVAEQLAAGYRTYYRNYYEPEHAYCVDRYSITQEAADTLHVQINHVVPAPTDTANPISITYDCGPTIAIHTHPYGDCAQGKDGKFKCQAGHTDIINCIPSTVDMRTAGQNFHRIGLLQCSEDMFTVYTMNGIAELKAYFPTDGTTVIDP